MTHAQDDAPAPRYLCLAGPTASGKSAAALAIAAAFAGSRPVEIVSVDSAQVYRGMDIGTAKPSRAERERVPHHLIDIADPAAPYSAARFVADAQRLIAAIDARAHLPLLVGGTMLYFKALFDGLDEMPAADSRVRAELDGRAAREGWPALHAELAGIDATSAARIAPNDAQRIQRALEVYRLSGMPISARQTRRPALEPPPLIALEPRDRSWLHARIAARFSAMLDAGLVDEVRALRRRADLHADLPSMRSVGYRQIWAALDASRTASNRVDADPSSADRCDASLQPTKGNAADGIAADPLDASQIERLVQAGTAATRQLAKRQLTWLRGMPWRQSVACDDDDATERVVALARRIVETPRAPRAS